MSLCFFIGYRDAPEEMRQVLAQAVLQHIEEYGVRDFVVGRFGNFDRMAWQVLGASKMRHPDLSLRLAVPYADDVRRVPLPWGFQDFYFPEELWDAPRRAAIPRLNQLLVRQATHLIAYVDAQSNNSRKVLAFAKQQVRHGELVLTELHDHNRPPQA